MPKFLVELNDGRKFQVEADSQPSEDEISSYMKQNPPKSGGLLDTAKDVGIGVAKGVGDTITSPGLLAPVINKMAGMSFHRPPMDLSPTREFLDSTLDSTNTAQKVGKGVEFAAEIAGPSALSRVGKYLKSRPAAAPIIEQFAPNIGGAAATEITRGGEKVAYNIPTAVEAAAQAARAPVAPTLADAVKAGGNGKLLEGTTLNIPKMNIVVSPNGKKVVQEMTEAGKFAGDRTTGKMNRAGLDALDGGIENGGLSEALKPAAVAPPKTRAKLGLAPKRALSIGEEEGINHLEKLQEALHGDAAPIGNGTFGKVAETADTLAKIGKVEEAATTIEKSIPLKVSELAEQMRAKYGSQRAGDMLFGNSKAGDVISRGDRAAAIKRLAPGPSRTPQIVADYIAQAEAQAGGTASKVLNKTPSEIALTLKGESGAASPALVHALAGGAAGAVAGGTQGETNEERMTNAAFGATAGAIGVPLIAHAFASGAPKAIQNYLYTSILSSPTSVAKAYLGGVGGAIAAAAEKIAAGNVRDGGAILQRLFSTQHVGDIVRGFRNPDSLKSGVDAAQRNLAGYGGKETFIGRIFDAGNAPAIKAMEAGGVTANDAWRYTLSGPPTTPMGKEIFNLWNKYFELRLATTLFPRVGIQVIERGLERSPLGLVKGLGLQTAGSKGERVARAAMGPAAGLAAYQGSDKVPDWAKPYLVALSGVYALPVASGMAAGMQRDRGKGVSEQATAALAPLGENSPFPRFGTTETLKNVATGAPLIPNIVRDIAQARDPYDRKTDMKSGGFFARTKAKIPGLRETLPVRGAQTNLAGEPLEDRSSMLTRAVGPAVRDGNKFKGVPPQIAGELQRLEININQPSFQQHIQVGKRSIPVPVDAAERSRAERRQYLLPQLEKIIDSTNYVNADDEKKSRMLKAVITRAEAAGNQRARATVIRLLREQGAFAQ